LVFFTPKNIGKSAVVSIGEGKTKGIGC